MKKAFFVYCFIFLFIFGVACKSEPNKQDSGSSINQGEQVDEYLMEHPIEALLEDIYGLDTKLTTGKIIYIHKYYNPGQELLTYELIYDKSDGEERFVDNTEKHFAMPIPKVSDKKYEGSSHQFTIDIHFNEDDSVLLKVKISGVDTSTVFPYIDNEYPDQLIPHFPEGLNVFAGIRGMEYIMESNTLSFERSWTVKNEFVPDYIGYYENVYQGNYEKVDDAERGFQSVVTRVNEYISIIASSQPVDESLSNVKFVIRYFLNDVP